METECPPNGVGRSSGAMLSTFNTKERPRTVQISNVNRRKLHESTVSHHSPQKRSPPLASPSGSVIATAACRWVHHSTVPFEWWTDGEYHTETDRSKQDRNRSRTGTGGNKRGRRRYPPAVQQAALVVEADVDAQQVGVPTEVVPLVHVDAVTLIRDDLPKHMTAD